MKLFCYFLTLLFVFFEVGLWDRRVGFTLPLLLRLNIHTTASLVNIKNEPSSDF